MRSFTPPCHPLTLSSAGSDCSNISATSLRASVSSTPVFSAASSNMTMQKGQATASVCGCAFWICSRRMTLTPFLPQPSSQALPPPPPRSGTWRARGSSPALRPVPQGGDTFQHAARRIVDIVVAADVAGVVVGHALVYRLGRRQLAVGDQLRQEVGVVDHLIIHTGLAAELRVFVFDGVEAVRAGGHKLLELVLLHGLDIRQARAGRHRARRQPLAATHARPQCLGRWPEPCQRWPRSPRSRCCTGSAARPATMNDTKTRGPLDGAKLFKRAGADFAIMGKSESCSVTRPGAPGQGVSLPGAGPRPILRRMNELGVKKLVTACPHCFNTIKNEYPQLGGKPWLRVLHHTEFIAHWLIKEGRLSWDGGGAGTITCPTTTPATSGATTTSTTRPAPCRPVSPAWSWSKRRTGTSSAPGRCGGGGGNAWLEGPGKKGVNVIRLEQIQKAQPQTLAVACPFCMVMFEDARQKHRRR